MPTLVFDGCWMVPQIRRLCGRVFLAMLGDLSGEEKTPNRAEHSESKQGHDENGHSAPPERDVASHLTNLP